MSKKNTQRKNRTRLERVEKDSMGRIRVPANVYWGAQTQRSLEHFKIGRDQFTRPFIKAFGLVKLAAAISNEALGVLEKKKAKWIKKAAREVIDGKWDDQFPLVIYQTGSGTQTNMNFNEVIANRANELARARREKPRSPVHPNDDVNCSQSSNDTFPTAAHIAAVLSTHEKLLPSLHALRGTFLQKSAEFSDVLKIGRTHLQDAVPLTVGQEFSGWCEQLVSATTRLNANLTDLYELAIGGTAVGTGLNSPIGFDEKITEQICSMTGHPFKVAKNKFEALSSSDGMAGLSGALRNLAGALMKIANDIRWLASGPRCGLGELSIPANEPGSSIMPGKVNPTQCEALTMVAVQVYGNDAAIAFAASQGHFQLNTYRPVMIHNLLHSIEILGDSCQSFRVHCVAGIEINRAQIKEFLDSSLMLVTALSPVIGYEKAAKIAQKALRDHLTLKQAALSFEFLNETELDRLLDPRKMVGPYTVSKKAQT